MRTICLILLLCVGSALPAGDPFFSDDKAQHFLVSTVAVGALHYALTQKAKVDDGQALTIGCSLVLSLGIAKEIRDSRKQNNFFSLKDLFWDVAGISLAALHVRLAAP
ncbi:MAG: hypothetical protein A2268_13985 [Candidatus Raymondbacteria bacterium RifOxyA12_full_50_37]|uniref:VanZ-like domain-containing protein n=1 Tax=Candidatus Raymondbacteria bacterium RIFOXYD12_FULL_49_13 TaxID=1817890 RepID=A0A1F7FKJ2_UNCRA|nr:MAG: hypothetical protein A2268_13985 [Candidatus Raymondbacteria bacterium RifOxyA12_full_50_37]OGJ88189.1 MAG: hypothetical protein A2248_19325 [Candidatus Raymondbacteria bacterium RIFOXYA2_FULL_49_16]OGJ98118.1 MAG: hypothetical protein A2350_00135 [Candidatus Raymondbacteria bacterium RifOxyB12_full_50_8]OGK01847.1 MAG: hypothetical protein A2487_14370 [Candidatus Raymondbacteria bacterium RifOxyC12_full_50_8]OGK07235.1 MAG: hypothetical protein A2519_13990 [Candidatus Raymondbacteria b